MYLGVKYDEGSCLTKDNLIEIAQNFPKKNINTNTSKKELVNNLQKNLIVSIIVKINYVG